jgi:tRNA (guanosine-2'-O-)-methyltransferase
LYAAGRKRSSKQKSETTPLSWETFDFGSSPKWDDRFANNRAIVAANEEELHTIRQQEAQQDVQLSQQLQQHTAAWQTLAPDIVQKATALLLPYVRPERMERIDTVLAQRTQHTRFLFENPINPSNVWACLRTLDAFGIQHVDVIMNTHHYQGKAAISQKRGVRTAMGSAQWLTLRNHPTSTTAAVASLRSQQPNVQIWASDLSDTSADIRQIDWTSIAAQGPICIVMGNEERGISSEMRTVVDGTFYLPMCGFAESFNLSVATAITAAHLSAASSSSTSNEDSTKQGPIRPGDLPKEHIQCLRLKGILNSVAQKRMANTLLQQEGIELPSETINLL